MGGGGWGGGRERNERQVWCSRRRVASLGSVFVGGWWRGRIAGCFAALAVLLLAVVTTGDAHLFCTAWRRVQWWGSLDEQPLPGSSLTRSSRNSPPLVPSLPHLRSALAVGRRCRLRLLGRLPCSACFAVCCVTGCVWLCLPCGACIAACCVCPVALALLLAVFVLLRARAQLPMQSHWTLRPGAGYDV